MPAQPPPVAQQRESERSMVAAARTPFGPLLKRYRVAAGLSQEALAERARLSTRGISDLERGRHRLPYRDTVARLAKALGLDGPERAALEAAARGLRDAAPADNPLREGGTRAAFLTTKLSVPPTRPTLVPRPRLLDRLHTGLHGPLTLLAAPAGSGKTTLLSAWHASPEGRTLPLAWVSLDASDNDPGRFWSCVLTALDRLAPGVGAPALALLQSPQPPSTEAVLTTLLNALDGVAADMILVLDDYHVIVAPPIHQGLAFLVQHLPPHLHLVVATRADPPLPLARLRAQGTVTEVRAADLRFTPEEAAAFLTEVMELPLSAEAIGALEARTEGWIVGLQLAALSLQGRPAEGIAPFIAAFAGSHRYVLDYLIDEVLLRQLEAVQTFLLHTCILERLCAPLCAAVVEDDSAQATTVAESQALLEGLERANLFLVPLDEERHWYRYHHLFADALRQRLRSSTPALDTALLHRRASAWFEGQGLLDEAISHALSAGAFEHAAVLMERIARTLYGQGALGTLHAWLDALPRSVVRARPGLCLVQSWLWLDRRRLDQAEQALQDADEALHAVARADGARNTGGEIAATRALWAALGGDAVQARAHAAAALDQLDRDNVLMHGWAHASLGFASVGQGDLAQAADVFGEAAAGGRTAGNAHAAIMATLNQTYVQRAQGALHLAVATCRQALTWSAAQGAEPSPITGVLHLSLAELLREWNDLDEAQRHLTDGIALSAQWGHVDLQLFGPLFRARLLAAQGDLDGALAVLHSAKGDAQHQEPLPLSTALLEACEAQLWLAQGNLPAAAAWARRAEREAAAQGPELNPLIVVYTYEHLSIAPIQVLLAQGRAAAGWGPLQRALVLLEQQRQEAERTRMPWRRIKALVLQALAYQALGDMTQSLIVLEQALALAAPEGYVRIFLDEGAPMLALLRQAAVQGIMPGYVRTLLAGGGEVTPPRDPSRVDAGA